MCPRSFHFFELFVGQNYFSDCKLQCSFAVARLNYRLPGCSQQLNHMGSGMLGLIVCISLKLTTRIQSHAFTPTAQPCLMHFSLLQTSTDINRVLARKIWKLQSAYDIHLAFRQTCHELLLHPVGIWRSNTSVARGAARGVARWKWRRDFRMKPFDSEIVWLEAVWITIKAWKICRAFISDKSVNYC